MKRISSPSQLPEWFDIGNYSGWEKEEPVGACISIQKRFHILYQLRHAQKSLKHDKYYLFCDHYINKTNDLFDLFEWSWKNPFNKIKYSLLLKLAEQENDYEEILEYNLEDNSCGLVHIATQLDGELIHGYHGRALKALSLFDIISLADKYKKLKTEIDTKVEHLTKNNNSYTEKVKKDLYKHFVVKDQFNEPIYKISSTPTINSAVNEIKQYFLNSQKPWKIPKETKKSDVHKLFEYKIAAYCDLKIWELLKGYSITNKCMAQAIFPDGKFSEWDLAPSKTIGRFIERLDQGDIDFLVAKAHEIDTLAKS